MNLFSRVLGNSPWVLRLPSFIAGLLLIPLAYIVIRKIYNKKIALLATFLVASSAQLISYSVQARGYSIQTFLFLTLILIIINILNTDSPWSWAWLIVVAALGFYTIPTFIYFFPPAMIWFFIQAWKHENRKALYVKGSASIVISGILVSLLYLPFVLKSGAEAIFSSGVAESLTWSDFIGQVPGNMNNIWRGLNLGIPIVISVVLLLGFALSLVFNKRISKYSVNIALIIIIWILIVYFAQRVAPFARVFVPFIPIYLGSAAAGIYFAVKTMVAAVEKKRNVRAGLDWIISYSLILLLFVVISLTTIIGQIPYQKSDTGETAFGTFRDAEKVAIALRNVLRPGDMVEGYADFTDVPLQYYFDREGIPLEYLLINTPTPDHPAWTNRVKDGLVEPGTIKRVFLIEGPKEEQYIQWVIPHAIEFGLLNEDGFSEPQVVFKTDYATVFQTDILENQP